MLRLCIVGQVVFQIGQSRFGVGFTGTDIKHHGRVVFACHMNAFHTAGFLFFYGIADFFSSGLKLFCKWRHFWRNIR